MAFTRFKPSTTPRYFLVTAATAFALAGCTIVTKSSSDSDSDSDAGNKPGSTKSDAAATSSNDAGAQTTSGDAALGRDGGPGQTIDVNLRPDAASDAGAQSADAATDASNADSDADGAVSTPAIVDPAPEVTEPGEQTCEGCPDSDATEFEFTLEGSTHPFLGTVTGADGNGEYYIEGPDGQAISGTIPTDENGNYAFTVPLFCGTQIAKLVWRNDNGVYVLVNSITREDCVDADIQLTLSWDDLGRDFELHLIKEGGRINDNATDCTWTSCISGTGLDWGEPDDPSDNPRKDVDNTGNYGPENIVYANPEPGTYTVMVEHWGGGSPEADGVLIFNVAGKTTAATITDLAPQHVWNVGTIEWPSGKVTLSGDVFDCTDNWVSGCTAELP